MSAFQKTLSYWKLNDWRANSVDLDEAVHHELPHLDLHCLQNQVFSFLALLVFNRYILYNEKAG